MTEAGAEKPFQKLRTFEWDENKNKQNVVKHGINFADAREVFADPLHYAYRSPRSTGETRYVTIGSMRGILVAVISTPHNGKIRIISARVARRWERQKYG